MAILMILNTWIYVINVRASSALKPLLKKPETYSLDLKQVHIGKTRPNKTPGVSIWQERVLGIGIGVENLALLMSALIQSLRQYLINSRQQFF